jgi:hypothetical protein
MDKTSKFETVWIEVVAKHPTGGGVPNSTGLPPLPGLIR